MCGGGGVRCGGMAVANGAMLNTCHSWRGVAGQRTPDGSPEWREGVKLRFAKFNTPGEGQPQMGPSSKMQPRSKRLYQRCFES